MPSFVNGQSTTFTGQAFQPQTSTPSAVATQTAGLLGSGLTFPMVVNSSGELSRSSGEENVDECLTQLLWTQQGERPFSVRDGVPFGTKLRKILFENSDRAQALAFQTVSQAITVWEPRVRLLDLQSYEVPSTDKISSKILLGIKYMVIATNNVRNLIYPFDLQTGQLNGFSSA